MRTYFLNVSQNADGTFNVFMSDFPGNVPKGVAPNLRAQTWLITLPEDVQIRLDPTMVVVPEDYVLVPREPTQEMCQQGQWKAREWPKFPLRIVSIWDAMIEAAPK